MPAAVDVSGFPLPPLDDKAALLIGSNGALVVGQHAYSDAMQPHLAESMTQQKHDRFGAKAFAEQSRITDTDRHRRAPVLEVDVVQSDFAAKGTVDFDDPGVRVIGEVLHPSDCPLPIDGLDVLFVHAIHFRDLGIRAQGEERIGVVSIWRAELDIPPLENW